jgi:hypothetical protein
MLLPRCFMAFTLPTRLPRRQVSANVQLPDIESQAQKDLVEGDACM